MTTERRTRNKGIQDRVAVSSEVGEVDVLQATPGKMGFWWNRSDVAHALVLYACPCDDLYRGDVREGGYIEMVAKADFVF